MDTEQVWTCSECDRTFANRNQWHSCVRLTIEEVLGGASDLAARLYEAVEMALGECGEFRVHPQKTRIAFISVMSFAGVRLAQAWIDLSFITPAPVDHRRIRSLVCYGPTSFVHEIRLQSSPEIDDDVRSWLCTAMRRGDQETLDPAASVEPMTGRPLEIVRVPLSVEAGTGPPGDVVPIPRYAAEIFEVCESVIVRHGDAEGRAWIDEADSPRLVGPSGWLEHLTLLPGDRSEVTLRADL